MVLLWIRKFTFSVPGISECQDDRQKTGQTAQTWIYFDQAFLQFTAAGLTKQACYKTPFALIDILSDCSYFDL